MRSLLWIQPCIFLLVSRYFFDILLAFVYFLYTYYNIYFCHIIFYFFHLQIILYTYFLLSLSLSLSLLIPLYHFYNIIWLYLVLFLCFFDNKLFHSFLYIIKKYIMVNFFHLSQNFSLYLLYHFCSYSKNEFYNHLL